MVAHVIKLEALAEEVRRIHEEDVYSVTLIHEVLGEHAKILNPSQVVESRELVDPEAGWMRSRLCVKEYETQKQVKTQRVFFMADLFLAMFPLEEFRSLLVR